MKNKEKTLKIVFGLILSISTIYLLYETFTMGIFPTKYLIPGAIVVMLIVGLLTFWLLKSNKVLSKIILVIVSIAMVFATTKVSEIEAMINNITGANTDTHTIHIMVRKDSKYETFEDVKDLTFNANTAMDAANIEKARELIKETENQNIHIKKYDNYTDLLKDFNKNKKSVLLMSDSNIPLMEEIDEDFVENTRIIKSYSYTTTHVDESNTNVSKDTFSIYITGIDTKGPINSTSRSDVNMIVTVNPQTHQILLTSIPRDFYVVLHTLGKKDKLSHSGVYGAMETVKTVEDFMGIDIDYYLRVNFSSVVNIVDALGGVDVYSKYSFTSFHNKTTFKKGMNSMNGYQALGFVRERYSLPGGDDSRVQNQQALLTGIINKAMTPAVIKNYSAFLSSMSDSFQTSIPSKQLNTLIRNQIDSMANWEIFNYQLAGTVQKNYHTYSMPGVMRVVKEPHMETIEKAKSLIHTMESNELLTKESLLITKK